jgi:apolipoprotein N-acyltransferase
MNKTIRFSLLAISSLIFCFAAFQMYQKPLWSYWTLAFLSAGWASFLWLALPLYTKAKSGLRWLALSTLSGVLLAAGFPMSLGTPLMFVALVPLLLVADEILQSEETIKKRLLMRYAYNAFVWWNILATWWVGNAGIIPGMIANFLNSFFMCLPILAYFVTREKLLQGKNENRAKILSSAALISFWFSWEYLHLHWDLSWTWLTLGNAFATHPDWVQWYEFTGVFGGGLWIWLANIFLYYIYSTRKNWAAQKIRIAASALALCLPLLISFYLKQIRQLEATLRKPQTNVEVVALQPNYEPHYEKFVVSDEIQLAHFLELAKKQVTAETDYLVLPETSFGVFDVDHLEAYEPIKALEALTDSFPKLQIVTGLDLVRFYAWSKNLPPTVRSNGSRNYEFYNGAIQLAHHQLNIPLYKKSKLVPGPEVLPFRAALDWLKPLFRKMGGTVEGLGTQPERSVFWNANGQAIGPVICYESIYGAYCGDYVRHGAQALFVMTNDGWWDDTPGYQQHSAFARLRAIELRRAVVRSANTGSSVFIDAFGAETQATPYGISAAIKGTITLHNELTFYAHYGDFLAKIGVLLSVIFAAMWFLPFQKKGL